MKLPTFVIEEMALPTFLEPILSILKTIMKKTNTPPTLQTQNIMRAPIGSSAQSWHYDHEENIEDTLGEENHSYFTILINLNHLDERCGGTEIWNKLSLRNELVRNQMNDIHFIIYRFVLNQAMH